MGEGSQQVSLMPMEDMEITPGGGHAMMGTTRFTLPPHVEVQPAIPILKVPKLRQAPQPQPQPQPQPVPIPKALQPQPRPALFPPPRPQTSTASSGGTSIQVVHLPILPIIKSPQQLSLPALVLGEKLVPSTNTGGEGITHTDAEGDTPMRDTAGPVSFPNGTPALRIINPPAFGDLAPASSTDYSVAP